jgi:hypothetical protein
MAAKAAIADGVGGRPGLVRPGGLGRRRRRHALLDQGPDRLAKAVLDANPGPLAPWRPEERFGVVDAKGHEVAIRTFRGLSHGLALNSRT